MNSRNMLLITWAVLITVSYFCWQSYQQLHLAQSNIQSLEAQLDSLRTTVLNYHYLQVAYTEIHSALRSSYDQLAVLRTDLDMQSSGRVRSLQEIKLRLDSLKLAYDTLLIEPYHSTFDHDLIFGP